MQISNLSEFLTTQQSIYAFLQGVYEKEVTEADIKKISEIKKPILEITKLITDKAAKSALEDLAKFIKEIPNADPKTITITLAADYASLFLSINKVPAHPSESTYREGVMMQHYRDEVLETYWSFGINPQKTFTEPEDHIATELSFMAFLCGKAVDAIKAEDNKKAKKFVEAQKSFLEAHLNKWAPMLVKDILDTGKTPFYKGLAVLTKEYLAMNVSINDEILKQLK